MANTLLARAERESLFPKLHTVRNLAEIVVPWIQIAPCRARGGTQCQRVVVRPVPSRLTAAEPSPAASTFDRSPHAVTFSLARALARSRSGSSQGRVSPSRAVARRRPVQTAPGGPAVAVPQPPAAQPQPKAQPERPAQPAQPAAATQPTAAQLPATHRRVTLSIDGVQREAVVDVRESLWETMTHKLGHGLLQPGLRSRAVRRVHGPGRRARRQRLHRPDRPTGPRPADHDGGGPGQGPGRRRPAPDPARLLGRRRLPVRHLHARLHHVDLRAADGEPAPDRRADRRRR